MALRGDREARVGREIVGFRNPFGSLLRRQRRASLGAQAISSGIFITLQALPQQGLTYSEIARRIRFERSC